MEFYSKLAVPHATQQSKFCLRHEDMLFSNVFGISLRPKVYKRLKKGKWWLRWQVRSQTCEIVCNTVPLCGNIVLSTNLSAVTFLVKFPERFAQINLFVARRICKAELSNPPTLFTQKMQNLCKFRKECSTSVQQQTQANLVGRDAILICNEPNASQDHIV